MNSTNSASQYFNDNWMKYQRTLNANSLYHREMLSTLNRFISEHFNSREFSFVDLGCGDSSTVVPILVDKKISRYIGVDAAPEVLQMAENNLCDLRCEKTLICDNMENAVSLLPVDLDIIYASYAVHHLSQPKKYDLLEACKNKLNKNGFLILVDVVLEKNQNHSQWLERLKARLQKTQHLSNEEAESRMSHPRAHDHPDSIATFEHFAKEQKWKKFEVLFQQEFCAFMVFSV